jgi:hypothetical protein
VTWHPSVITFIRFVLEFFGSRNLEELFQSLSYILFCAVNAFIFHELYFSCKYELIINVFAWLEQCESMCVIMCVAEFKTMSSETN